MQNSVKPFLVTVGEKIDINGLEVLGFRFRVFHCRRDLRDNDDRDRGMQPLESGMTSIPGIP